jgi:hypothetical protein
VALKGTHRSRHPAVEQHLRPSTILQLEAHEQGFDLLDIVERPKLASVPGFAAPQVIQDLS